MTERKGYLWLVSACICFLCTGLLLAMISNTKNAPISLIQNAYYVLMPVGLAGIGFFSLRNVRTIAVASSLAALTIVAGLVIAQGIKVLPFALPITIPLIAATFELLSIYDLSQSIDKKKAFAIVATLCFVSISLGLFFSYALGLKFPRF